MAEYLNAKCAICDKKYHLCKTCEDVKTFSPWRTVTDTIDCYKIFLVLSEYTKTKNKEQAKKELSTCNLKEKDTFAPHIKAAIDEIMAEPEVKVETSTKETKEKEVKNSQSVKIVKRTQTAKENEKCEK